MGLRSLAGVAIALLLAVAAPSAAGAATFGSSLPAPTPGNYDACGDPCTAGLVEVPGAQTRSPADGRIVRFRLRTGAGSDPQKVRFRVIRSTDGEKFIGAGTSPEFDLPTTAGVTEFPVDMPVRAGDYLGIDQPGGGKRALIVAQNEGAFQAGWFPALADTGAARASGNPRGSDPTRYEVLLQADVEPTAGPSPTPNPGSPPPAVPRNCTSAGQVATCPDASQPAMCGPASLGFPQCSLPMSLPTACSGSGTGLPTCRLPGSYVVACGGLGLSLPVCNLPPQSVPDVCGPTTAGLRPCEAAHNQVLACGATTAGFAACGFKTLIEAPEPIDVSSGALDLVVGCPTPATASAVIAQSKRTCAADVDFTDLVNSKRAGLQSMALGLSWAYLKGQYPDPEFERLAGQYPAEARRNYTTFNYRARELILVNLKSELSRGYSGDPFTPLDSSAVFPIAELLRSRAPSYPRVNFGSYEGPTELWQQDATLNGGRRMALAIVDTVNELYQVQEKQKKAKKSRASSAPVAVRAAVTTKPLFHKRVKLRRGKRGTRIHLRLPRKTVRTLRRRASRKSHAVAVRLVVSFKAKPRPIVRFVDFRIKVKRARR